MRKKALSLSVFTATSMVASPALAQVDVPAVEAEQQITDVGTGDADVQLVTSVTGAVLPGQDAWVHFMWIGDAVLSARNFQVTATGSEGVEVGYPANHFEQPRDFSSLMDSSVLDALAYDFTALKLVVSPTAVDPAVKLTVSYDSDTGPVTQTFESKITIDTAVFEGEALELATGPLGSMPQGASAWLPLEVKALFNASEIQIRVADAGGFDIGYPNEVDYSSLSQGSRIIVGAEDFAAIRLDSLDLTPGIHTVRLDVSYFVGLTPVTQRIERTIEVVGSSADPDPVGSDPVGSDPVGSDPVGSDPVGPVTVGSIAQGVDGWRVDPYGTDTATTGVWGYGQPPVGIWSELLLEMGSTPSGNKGWFTLSGTGTAMGDHDLDEGESSVLSPVYAVPDVDDIRLDFDYYLSCLTNASSDDSLRVVMITENGNKVILNEQARANTNTKAKWKSMSVELSRYAGQDVQFLITAGDRGVPSYVEAAIDGFTITAG